METISKTLITNQSAVIVPDQEICREEAAFLLASSVPSRFRRKKGYSGKTAQTYNKNHKSMPKGF